MLPNNVGPTSPISSAAVMKVNKSTSKDKSRKGHSRKEERPGGPLITSFFKPRATISSTDCEGRTEHIQLDTAQTDVLNRARKDGGSVFFTGAAGTPFPVQSLTSDGPHPSPRHGQIDPTPRHNLVATKEIH